jgi:hypothetical protein
MRGAQSLAVLELMVFICVYGTYVHETLFNDLGQAAARLHIYQGMGLYSR